MAALILEAASEPVTPSLLTPIGGWGPWINGGGWLTVQEQKVDFLYRDLSRVGASIEACRTGQVEIVYQPGHDLLAEIQRDTDRLLAR